MEDVPKINESRNSLLHREQKLASDIHTLYARSEKALIARLNALSRELKGLTKDEAPGKFLQRERVLALLLQIEDVIKQNGDRAAEITTRAQALNASMALRDSALFYEAGLVSTWNRLPVEALDTLAGMMADGTPLSQRLAREGRDAAERAKQVLFDGVLQGKNARYIAKELRKAAVDLTRENALVIARTESIRAYRESTLESYKANTGTIRAWRWLCSKSLRTCPVCLALDGTIHPLTEAFGSHPACRCVPVAVLIERNIDLGKTGREWFAEQSEDRQKLILGPAKHKLYSEGHITLDDLVDRRPTVWGPSARVRSLTDLILQGTITPEQAKEARRRAA
jgi:SPP1 gp7 family putative phage head morphogenesis protein